MPKSPTKTKARVAKDKGRKVKRSVKATIKKLKTKVRKRIENGEPLTTVPTNTPAGAMKSREVQMKIAHLEAQIRQAETVTRGRKRLPAAEVRLTNEIATLRKRLK